MLNLVFVYYFCWNILDNTIYYLASPKLPFNFFLQLRRIKIRETMLKRHGFGKTIVAQWTSRNGRPAMRTKGMKTQMLFLLARRPSEFLTGHLHT